MGGDPLAEATTAQEAVAAAVRHLPADSGPVTYGAPPGQEAERIRFLSSVAVVPEAVRA
ncbi:DUF6193 family natural product biosynthesis protein [Streptomyces sp. NPDC056255]|uniref:DUF6193 family natural product biosynthesis protein n=1 Tax=Streptomyces sp. NPDC056255 TaxID=3345764 RepID=UPI0035D86490